MDDDDFYGVVVVILIIMALIGAFSYWRGYVNGSRDTWRDAIKVGVAHYESNTNGEPIFTWHTNRLLEVK